MKKVILLFTFIVLSYWSFAQDYSDMYVQFLGIPVDGSKSEMISKIRNKGFSYDSRTDELSGLFNGSNVIVKVADYNGVVYRIMVVDDFVLNETDIIIRFNKLLEQFENNKKYTPYSGNERIPRNENIHYEMSYNNKRYEAAFFQKYDMSNLLPFDIDYDDLDDEALDSLHIVVDRYVKENLGDYYDEYYLDGIQGKTKKEIYEFDKEFIRVTILAMETAVETNRTVWFMISEDELSYQKYRILMFYDNGFNEPRGEDL